jgi:hypothetical protein
MFLKRVVVVILLILLVLLRQMPVALSAPVGEELPLPEGALTEKPLQIPDFETFSFSDLGGAVSGGSFNPVDLDPDGLYTEELSYTGAISWDAGERPENLISLGDFGDVSSLANWSLGIIGQYVPEVNWARVPLSVIGFLKDQAFEDFVDAVPGLRNLKLKDVKPLENFLAFSKGWSPQTTHVFEGLTLGALSDNPNFSTLNLGKYDFSKSFVTDIPNLDEATFSSFPGWENAKISEIPQLSRVPFTKFIGEIGEYMALIGKYMAYLDLATQALTPVAKVDVAFGPKEGNQAARGRQTVTGSYKEGFAVPCDEDSCQYLELTDLIPYPTPLVHGKQWISGKSQKVDGGEGILGNLAKVAGVKEPTGRHPFTRMFKVVLLDVNEAEGKGEFGIYFRTCVRWPFNLGCSPYLIGPFPWFPAQEKGPILLGFDFLDKILNGVLGPIGVGLPPIVDALSKLADVAPQYAEQIKGAIDAAGRGSNPGSDPGPTEGAVSTVGNCELYQGVNLAALKKSIGFIESTNNYYSVGDYVSGADNGRNFGRALGYYQYMSYGDNVRPYFAAKPGGLEILDKIRRNVLSEAEIQSAIRTYFPPAAQEELNNRDWKAAIASQRRLGKNVSDTVYYVACRHNLGTCPSGTRLGYADRALSYYQSNSTQQAAQNSCVTATESTGLCTGRYIWPTRGTITSEFSPWRCTSFRCGPHQGIDIGNVQGTPIYAADGGKITFAGFRGGYGNSIEIRHCNGDITFYAHLSHIRVSVNQSVIQGQTIGDMGSTGDSTGSHLHFEAKLRVKGDVPVNPRTVLPRKENIV